MKKIMIAATALVMAVSVNAQTKTTKKTSAAKTTTSNTTTAEPEEPANTNVIKASTITTTTVNDGTNDPKKLVRTDNTEAVNQIQIQDANSKSLNKSATDTPYQVNTSTSVMADKNFNQRIGQIHNYDMDGKQYLFISDQNGFYIKTPDNKDMGKIRKTSNNSYIMKNKKTTSIGHFDASNNFVVETYDDKTDAVTTQTYTYKKQ